MGFHYFPMNKQKEKKRKKEKEKEKIEKGRSKT